jgi:hypothetical protein
MPRLLKEIGEFRDNCCYQGKPLIESYLRTIFRITPLKRRRVLERHFPNFAAAIHLSE